MIDAIKNMANDYYSNAIDNLFKEKVLNLKTNRLKKADDRSKCVYVINFGEKGLGFFAVYRILLEFLYFADVTGLTPVIYLNENFLYKEKEGKLKNVNPYEYYFLQPIQDKYLGKVKMKSLVKSRKLHYYMVELILNGEYGTYYLKEQYITMLAQIHRKYIHFNTRTENYVEKGIRGLLNGKKTLGVHVRGSDFKRKYNIHPVRVTEEEYITEIEKCMEQYRYEQIFLATDDENSLKVLHTHFGEKLVYYTDVVRTSSQQSVAFIKSDRGNHHYKLGLEVIRDACTLSCCDALVAGVSQVSICVRIMKQAKGKPFEYLKICDKGIWHNGKDFEV